MTGELRLLTLNIHGEPNGRDERTLSVLTDFFCRETPTVAALQEVCQSADAPPVASPEQGYALAEPGVLLRRDLFVLRLVHRLAERGERYFWSYLPIKLGYGRYDEGVAILSREPIVETSTLTVSRTSDYLNFKTRRLLGARIGTAWYYSVHFGWLRDPEEPFAEQWSRTLSGLKRHKGGPILLMGDFNAPAELRGGGYDLVSESGYGDVWCLASGEGATVEGSIDGWDGNGGGLRIDQIRPSYVPRLGTARRVFDGANEPTVSDHYGVYATLKGEL